MRRAEQAAGVEREASEGEVTLGTACARACPEDTFQRLEPSRLASQRCLRRCLIGSWARRGHSPALQPSRGRLAAGWDLFGTGTWPRGLAPPWLAVGVGTFLAGLSTDHRSKDHRRQGWKGPPEPTKPNPCQSSTPGSSSGGTGTAPGRAGKAPEEAPQPPSCARLWTRPPGALPQAEVEPPAPQPPLSASKAPGGQLGPSGSARSRWQGGARRWAGTGQLGCSTLSPRLLFSLPKTCTQLLTPVRGAVGSPTASRMSATATEGARGHTAAVRTTTSTANLVSASLMGHGEGAAGAWLQVQRDRIPSPPPAANLLGASPSWAGSAWCQLVPSFAPPGPSPG